MLLVWVFRVHCSSTYVLISESVNCECWLLRIICDEMECWTMEALRSQFKGIHFRLNLQFKGLAVTRKLCGVKNLLLVQIRR